MCIFNSSFAFNRDTLISIHIYVFPHCIFQRWPWERSGARTRKKDREGERRGMGGREREEEGTLSKNLANLYKPFLSWISFFYISLWYSIKNITTSSAYSCFSINQQIKWFFFLFGLVFLPRKGNPHLVDRKSFASFPPHLKWNPFSASNREL